MREMGRGELGLRAGGGGEERERRERSGLR